jgi:hypothetical protein
MNWNIRMRYCWFFGLIQNSYRISYFALQNSLITMSCSTAQSSLLNVTTAAASVACIFCGKLLPVQMHPIAFKGRYRSGKCNLPSLWEFFSAFNLQQKKNNFKCKYIFSTIALIWESDNLKLSLASFTPKSAYRLGIWNGTARFKKCKQLFEYEP